MTKPKYLLEQAEQTHNECLPELFISGSQFVYLDNSDYPDPFVSISVILILKKENSTFLPAGMLNKTAYQASPEAFLSNFLKGWQKY
jgi:hypothetical protein